MADPTSSQYDQESKKESRAKVIEHAVRCLTTERSTSVCVKRDHVARVWKQLHESGKAYNFTEEERNEIEEQIGYWEHFHDSQVQKREPSDLRVCYLCGNNPINDLEVLRMNGVTCQNVWAIEKDSKNFEKARNAIKNSNVRNVKLLKGDILKYLKDLPGQFDIIYLDACGPLPSKRQETLKIIGYVFLYNKLTSPGALITNFSFPPPQDNSASSQDEKEREVVNFLVKEYMKYRLCNVSRKDNSPENNAEYLNERTDEDNYGDYVSFQVIDSAYLFIPAQRMLSTYEDGESLWSQVLRSKEDLVGKSDSYNEKSTKTTTNQKSMALREKLKEKCEVHAKSHLFFKLMSEMAKTFHEKPKDYFSCKAWIRDIFPDCKSEAFLKDKYNEFPVLLTTRLVSSPTHIIDFYSNAFVECLEPLFKAVADGRIPSCCDMTTPGQSTCLLAGLVYGQVACPSFPVMDKLFRLSYISNKRQMFADVFVFDKCRYMYEESSTAHCADSAIELPKYQMVVRMVVDGLRKHLGGICSEDLFKFCNVARINAIREGGVSFPNSERGIPERQKIVSDQNNSLHQARNQDFMWGGC